MNYQVQVTKARPFEGLSKDEALRLFIYMTRIMNPAVNADEVYRRYGYIPEGGTLNVFKAMELAEEVAGEVARDNHAGGTEPDTEKSWVDQYVQDGIRRLTDDDRKELIGEIDFELGFNPASWYSDCEFIAVRGVTDSETWLCVTKLGMQMLGNGQIYEFPRWSKYYIVLNGTVYNAMIAVDEFGVDYIDIRKVRSLPDGCRSCQFEHLYGLLLALIAGGEREFTDEEFDEMEEFEKRYWIEET